MDIENYRPIMVLNTDYKIMTKVLVMRLSSIVPEIIYPAQVGFMKDRQLEDQTKLAHIIIN